MEWTEKMTKLADFAAERHVDRNVLTQYVRYHPEIFDGHTTEYKRSLYGDDEAMKALDKKYPLPKPVEVIKDPEADELRKQVINLQEQLLASQKQVIALTEKAVQAESAQALLADREKQLDAQISRVTRLEEELEASKIALVTTSSEKQKVELLIEQTTKDLADEIEKNSALESKLQDVKNMSWVQRLFWKG